MQDQYWRPSNPPGDIHALMATLAAINAEWPDSIEHNHYLVDLALLNYVGSEVVVRLYDQVDKYHA